MLSSEADGTGVPCTCPGNEDWLVQYLDDLRARFEIGVFRTRSNHCRPTGSENFCALDHMGGPFEGMKVGGKSGVQSILNGLVGATWDVSKMNETIGEVNTKWREHLKQFVSKLIGTISEYLFGSFIIFEEELSIVQVGTKGNRSNGVTKTFEYLVVRDVTTLSVNY